MTDTLSLGPTPADEPCEQLGPHYDPTRAWLECKVYIAQLRRQFGKEPGTARLKVTSNPHDFGTYYEVGVRFDDDDEVGQAYAYRLEKESPAEWDEAARLELGL